MEILSLILSIAALALAAAAFAGRKQETAAGGHSAAEKAQGEDERPGTADTPGTPEFSGAGACRPFSEPRPAGEVRPPQLFGAQPVVPFAPAFKQPLTFDFTENGIRPAAGYSGNGGGEEEQAGSCGIS